MMDERLDDERKCEELAELIREYARGVLVTRKIWLKQTAFDTAIVLVTGPICFWPQPIVDLGGRAAAAVPFGLAMKDLLQGIREKITHVQTRKERMGAAKLYIDKKLLGRYTVEP